MKALDILLLNLRKNNSSLFQKDFLLTWDKTRDELELVLDVAAALKQLYESNIATRCFE
ncbi:MAG: knotted carbamoyltransferase YgeW, partial [Bacteroidetes bacterium]|nr:knotted carbamoyltransferase YgeW [Bacteroidota bacterium]